MLTSKQRAELKRRAEKEKAITQIGKNGITENLIEGVSAALKVREIVKITVLNNNDEDKNELARVLSIKTESEVLAVIGKKIILYKKKED